MSHSSVKSYVEEALKANDLMTERVDISVDEMLDTDIETIIDFYNDYYHINAMATYNPDDNTVYVQDYCIVADEIFTADEFIDIVNEELRIIGYDNIDDLEAIRVKYFL